MGNIDRGSPTPTTLGNTTRDRSTAGFDSIQSEVPLRPVEGPLVEQAVPLQSMGCMVEHISTLQPVEDPPVEQVDLA